MKKYFFPSVLLFFFSLTWSCSISKKMPADNSSLLVGTWQYDSVYEQEGIDEESLIMLEIFFADMNFDFSVTKQYKAVMMGKKGMGTWALSEDASSIVLTDTEGVKAEIPIVEIDKERLIIQLQDKSFVLKRS